MNTVFDMISLLCVVTGALIYLHAICLIRQKEKTRSRLRTSQDLVRIAPFYFIAALFFQIVQP